MTFGSTESTLTKQIVKTLVQDGSSIGVINVRLYSPFLDSEFFKVLPTSTKKIIVLDRLPTSLLLLTLLPTLNFTVMLPLLFLSSLALPLLLPLFMTINILETTSGPSRRSTTSLVHLSL